MWMLFVVIIGVATPIQVDGYTTKAKCEATAKDAEQSFSDWRVKTWCTIDPWKWEEN